MADANDWDTRISKVKSDYQRLQNIVDSHQLKTRSIEELAKSAQDLKDEVEETAYLEKKTEQEASTYDREFIEKRKAFPDPFRPSKIYTIQDFILYFLLVSYILFIIGLYMTISDKKIVIFVSFLSFIVGGVLIYKYA